MGYEEYEPLARKYRVPIVVTGFEPVDLLEGVYTDASRCWKRAASEVDNQYTRAVRREGNRAAQKLIARCLKSATGNGAGIGTIPQSGLRLRRRIAEYDAETRFAVKSSKSLESDVVHQRVDSPGPQQAP